MRRVWFLTDSVTTRLVLFCAVGEGREVEDIARLVKVAITWKILMMAEQQVSVRDFEVPSECHSARASYSTESRITKGAYRPGEKALLVPERRHCKCLSGASNIPIERLRAAARFSGRGTLFKLPGYVSGLPASERSSVEHLVRAVVDAKGERRQALKPNDEQGGPENTDPDAELRSEQSVTADELYGLAPDHGRVRQQKGDAGI